MLDQPLSDDPAEKLAVIQHRLGLAQGVLHAVLNTAKATR